MKRQLRSRRFLSGMAVAILSLCLMAQAEIDEPWNVGLRQILPVPTRAPQPTPLPRPTSTPDPELQKIYATAIAAATERAGSPPATPYPTYVPIPTSGPGGDITGRYNEYIAKVVDKLGVPNPNVTVVDYNLSALAQLHISPAEVARHPELAAFYFRRTNMIALITPISKVLDHYTLWHEFTHALIDAPDCGETDRLSVEENVCVHNREFLYLEKDVWETFNLVMNRDIGYGVADSCELARAIFPLTATRRGDSGSGVGFPVVFVNNEPDADGDGVVCERGGS